MLLRFNPVSLAALLALLLSASPCPAIWSEVGGQSAETVANEKQVDLELDAQVREVASKLRCPTCRALSVEDSRAGMAEEMRKLIREQLRAGKTPDEVTAYFVERYGEWILLKPKAEGFNWTVWLLPILMLAGGLFFVFVTARRWVEQGRARAEAVVQESEQGEA